MRTALFSLILVLAAANSARAGSDALGLTFFEQKIRPVLAKHCYECHSVEAKKQKGGLLLDSRAALLEGGKSGPAIVPGKPAESLLLKAVRHTSEDLRMPPKGKLPDALIADLTTWVSMGAPDPRLRTNERRLTAAERKFWAFQQAQRPALPKVHSAAQVRTPVDAFVLAKLEAKGLTFAPPAERAALLRRAYFDLTGLPPSPEEVSAFLADTRADAYERLLDRLLASPHFGERWGRHWLDAAGHVDIMGTDNDAGIINIGEGKWRYRDYVIRSFNQDKPFDLFLTEQLAGDEQVDWRAAPVFTPEIQERLIATGFLRTTPDNSHEPELNKPREHHFILQQTAEVVVNNLLALTMQCAKCHDHKYEPITQREYYRVLAIFNPAFNSQKWLQPKARALADVAVKQKRAIDKENDDIEQQIKKLKDAKADNKKIAELSARRRSLNYIQAVYDVGPPPPTFLFKRGNHETPGSEVSPGFLEVLTGPGAAAAPKVKAVGATSGRRLALAQTLTDPRSPAGALAARVQVNRIWLHLFGRGLVDTPDNLGLSGVRPTHPELLEWLTARFLHDDRRFKPLVRLLMTSTVYRQSSVPAAPIGGADPDVLDPDNLLLWKMRLRRLESESIRDALLAVSARLDATMGGPPIPLEVLPSGMVIIKRQGLPSPTSPYRRSIYLLNRRAYHPTFLDVFDQPLLPANCVSRKPSSVVTQSLTMLNDSFVLERADDFAKRVAKDVADPAPQPRIERAFRIALGRAASTKETVWSAELLQRQEERYRAGKLMPEQATHKALTDLCHMLLNTNEFLYIP